MDASFHACHQSGQQYAGTAALHLQRTPPFATHLASKAGAEPSAATARASEATAAVRPEARPAFRRDVAIAVVQTEFAAAFGIEAAATVPTPHAAATHAAAKPAATEVLCSRVLCIGDLMSPIQGFISPQSRILDSNGIVAYLSSSQTRGYQMPVRHSVHCTLSLADTRCFLSLCHNSAVPVP